MIVITKCILLIILCFVRKALGALNDEISSESVELKFYLLKTNEWTEDGNTVRFQDILVSEANQLCSTKPGDCGLAEWNQTFSFMQSDVVIADGYPKMAGSDLEVRFYILYPGNSSLLSTTSQQFVLNKEATETVLMASKEKLEEAFDTYVTYVNDKFYGIPPDTKTNEIIIPIAFIVLAVVAIIAIALTMWSKKKDKQRQKMSLKKKHFSTKESTNHFSTKTPNGRQVDKPLTNHNQDKEYNLMTCETLDNKQTEHKHMPNTTTQNTDQVAILDEIKARSNELPPLETPDGQDEIKEKRKKRKSKRKHKQKEKEAHENPAVETSDNEIKNVHILDVQPNNTDHVEETIM